MNLIVDGNGPAEAGASATLLPSQGVGTTSSVVASPILTPIVESQSWLNGTTIFWGIIVIIVIGAIIYWLNKNGKMAKKGK